MSQSSLLFKFSLLAVTVSSACVSAQEKTQTSEEKKQKYLPFMRLVMNVIILRYL